MQTINLLPKTASQDKSGLILMGLAQLAMVGLIVGLILAATGFQASQQQLTKQLTERQQEKERLKDTLARAQQLQIELAYIEDRKKTWTELTVSNPALSPLINSLVAALPTGIQLSSFSLKGSDLTLAGIATDRSAITSFADSLNKVNGIASVTVGQTTSQENGVNFTITSKLTSASPSPKSSVKEEE